MFLISNTSQTSEFAAPTNLTGVDMADGDLVGVSIAATVTTPAAGAFTAAVTDICTKAGHLFVTGLKVTLTTTGGLPAPLAAATDYFVIYVNANEFKLATSLALAQAGTAIDITTTGTGVHTITPTAIAACTFKLQGSSDDSVYFDIPISASGDASKTGTITVTANFHIREAFPAFRYYRVAYTMTAGQVSVVQKTMVKK